jgi:hypothetical protein
MDNTAKLLARYQCQHRDLQETLGILVLLTFCRHREKASTVAKIFSVLTKQFCSPEEIKKNIKQLKKVELLIERGNHYYFCPYELTHYLCAKLSENPHFFQATREIKSVLITITNMDNSIWVFYF